MSLGKERLNYHEKCLRLEEKKRKVAEEGEREEKKRVEKEVEGV